jgi:hypothetical protein
MPNAGCLIRYAKNVTLSDVTFGWGNICDDYGAALDAAQVEGLTLRRVSGQAAHAGEEAIRLTNVTD